MIHEIGPHRVKHGNVMNGIDDLMQGDKVDLMYSDPPWGGGNLKYWATMNKKMTGEEIVAPELEPFLNQIFSIASQYVTGTLLVEYGCAWRDDIRQRGIDAGFQPLTVVNMLYGSPKRPLDLHVFSRDGRGLPDGFIKSVNGTHGYEAVRCAFGPYAERHRGGIALDPCCGMGYTAQACLDFGLNFRGNELNRARLQKTIDRLEKATG